MARATSLDSGLSAPPAPLRGMLLLPLVVLDLVLLLCLRDAPLILAGLVGLAAAVWLLRRGERALAFVAVGLPLLDPLGGQLGSGLVLFVAGRVLLLLPLLALLLCGFWGLTEPRGRSALRILLEPAVVCAVLLAVVFWRGLAGTPSPEYGSEKLNGYLIGTLPLLLGAALLLARPADPATTATRARHFMEMVLLFELLIALAGIHNFFTGFYPWRFRLVSLGMNPIWVGRHAGQGLLLVIVFASLGWIGRGRAFFLAGVLGWVFWLSGSRGVLLALLLAIVVWLAGDRRSRRWLPLGLLVAIPVLAVIAFSFTLEGSEKTNPFLGRGASNFFRARLFDIARRTVSEVGFFGTGTGGFAGLARMGDIRYYPHNVLVEVGLENGVPGLALLLGFIAATLLAARRGLRRLTDPAARDRLRVALTLFVFHLWNAQVSGDVNGNEWVWLWAGAILAFARFG